MHDIPIHIPQMLLIGSTGRNSGKTTLASAGVRRWKENCTVIGLKVTSMRDCDGKCPRGGSGCGACSNLHGHFELSEETDTFANKDTSILLASGCQKVYWLRTIRAHIDEGIAHFLALIPSNVLIVCESNSLRHVVKPGIFIMLKNTTDTAVKESAGNVLDKADLVLEGNIMNSIDTVLDNIKINISSGGMVTVSGNSFRFQ